jgi:hypothetical protein
MFWGELENSKKSNGPILPVTWTGMDLSYLVTWTGICVCGCMNFLLVNSVQLFEIWWQCDTAF